MKFDKRSAARLANELGNRCGLNQRWTREQQSQVCVLRVAIIQAIIDHAKELDESQPYQWTSPKLTEHIVGVYLAPLQAGPHRFKRRHYKAARAQIMRESMWIDGCTNRTINDLWKAQ